MLANEYFLPTKIQDDSGAWIAVCETRNTCARAYVYVARKKFTDEAVEEAKNLAFGYFASHGYLCQNEAGAHDSVKDLTYVLGLGAGGVGRGAAATSSQGRAPSLVKGLEWRPDARHIFRVPKRGDGHLVQDTAANRALIESAYYRGSFKGYIDRELTVAMYTRSLPDGTQAWVQVRNGSVITNGGVNQTPRP